MAKRIESQREKLCTVHAINNALQNRVVDENDAVIAIRQRFEFINEKLALKGKPFINYDTFYRSESEKGFSIDLFRKKLRDVNLFLHHRKIPVSAKIYSEGSWVVLGKYPTFNHAIGISDGYLIESIGSIKPYKLKDLGFPQDFVPLSFFEINSEPPVREESTEVIEID